MPVRCCDPAVHAAFDEGSSRLYLRDAGEERLTILFPWPTMRALTRGPGAVRWQLASPEIRVLPTTGAETSARLAVARYLESVPPEVRAAVSPFGSGHWDLLTFAARCGKPAVDLLRGNPALGFMLAHCTSFRRIRSAAALEAAGRVIAPHRKQRDMLAWLGFPATEPVRNIVRKIDPAHLSLEPLPPLRPQLCGPDVQVRLSHLPRIDDTILRIASNGTLPLFSQALLTAIASGRQPVRTDLPGVASDTARMWRLARPATPLPMFANLRRLVEAHDALASTTDWQRVTRRRSDGWPLPPVAGNDDIVPIASLEELAAEGRGQHNCVGSYAPRVRKRQVFVYRVLRPTRATLSLVKYGREWDIDELKASCNYPVPADTRAAVEAWLADARRNGNPRPPRPRQARNVPTGPLLALLDTPPG